jgi:hypothetical protein
MPRLGARCIAWLALAAALSASCTREPAASFAPSDQPGPLLPQLADRQQQVDQFEVLGAGNKTLLRFRRVEGSWLMDERPWHADGARIAQYLLTLAQARRVEAKTDRATMYPRIGVEDVSDPDATGVELHLSGSKAFDARVVIGEAHKPSGGRFARLSAQKRSWVVDADIGIDPDPLAWLDHRVLALPLPLVESVRMRPRNAPQYTLVMREDRFRPDDAPAAAMRDSHAGDQIASALVDFQAEDVALGGANALASQQLEYALVDGGTLTVSVWREGQRDWARIEAGVDDRKASAWSLQSGRPDWEKQAQQRASKWDAQFAGRKFLLSPQLARTLTLDHSQVLEGDPPPQ